MKDELKYYINKFDDIYNGEPWLDVTFLLVLNKVDHDTAFHKPGNKVHSIAEIVSHIIEYRKFLLAQFEQDDKFDVSQRASFDTTRYDDKKNNVWANLLKTLEKTQNSLIAALKNSDNETLKRKVFHRKYNIKYLLDGIIQHDIYHLGQLMLLLRINKH